ncbi:hypothetical protein CROQUDRAFT_91058 [Cronartium quercuum f. sp. fusiforme G11]|uniref:Uncharacterized protein n=1 Tax=Cronartium quercuum f. sp. fusiforme G11 TaxID=708437 RepID=A0A9P6NQJ3_9BASI|nr:hypothetical protein CROQUDRAFT_91058 [Cronartium quercuum f. sp. fusiforme G11]
MACLCILENRSEFGFDTKSGVARTRDSSHRTYTTGALGPLQNEMADRPSSKGAQGGPFSDGNSLLIWTRGDPVFRPIHLKFFSKWFSHPVPFRLHLTSSKAQTSPNRINSWPAQRDSKKAQAADQDHSRLKNPSRAR